MTILSALLVLALPIQAMDLDGRDQYSDPDVVAEMDKAKGANLDNAMERGRDNALKAAKLARTLMSSAGQTIDGALRDIRGVVGRADLPRAGRIRDQAERLRLASGMLDAKARAYAQAARRAGFGLGAVTAEELLRGRARYNVNDRVGDLARCEKYVKKGRKKFKQKKGVLLTEEQEGLLAAVDAFSGELRSAGRILKKLRSHLKRSRKRLGTSAVVERLDDRLDQIDLDRAAVAIERSLIEYSVRLMVLDEISFDITR